MPKNITSNQQSKSSSDDKSQSAKSKKRDQSKQSKQTNQSKKENFLKKTEQLPNSQLKLMFELPQARVEKYLEQAAQDLSKELKVDGFRKGKVPRKVVEQNVGEERLMQEAAEVAIRENYINAILEKKVEAVGEPKVEIAQIGKDKDLAFTAIVDVLPEVDLGGKWQEEAKKINQKFAKEGKIEVKKEDIQRELDFLANQRAKVATVSRVAKKGDQIKVDFEVFQGGVALENGAAQDQAVVIGEGRFIPGFEEQLIGLKAGDEKEFELEFPKEYHAKHLAGKKATFKVRVKLVQERQVPEVNEEFAKGIGKFENLQQLKDNLEKGIKQEAQNKQAEKQKKELVDKLIENVQLEIPQVLIDRELDRMMAELENSLTSGGLQKEQYFQNLNTTEEKIREQWEKKEAPDRVKAALILRHLGKENQLEPKPEEVEAEVNKFTQQYQMMGGKVDQLDVTQVFQSAKGELTNRLVFEWLMKL